MKFLSIVCLLCGFCTPAFSLDRNAFAFTKYDLNVRVEPEQHRMAVRGKITLRNDSGVAQKNLALQVSSSLDWRSILIDGKPAEFIAEPYTSDIDHTGSLSEAIVTLPQELPPKATIELEIGYEGVVVKDATRLTRIGVPDATAVATDWDEIGKSSGAVRGVGYVTWYPVAIETANLSSDNSVAEAIGRWTKHEVAASMRVDLCLWSNSGNPLTTAMNDSENGLGAGTAAANSDASEDCREHEFPSLGYAVPLFTFGTFETLSRPEISVRYRSEHKNAAENMAAAADKVLPFVTSWFGRVKQPAVFVELPEPHSAPYENNGVLLTPLNDIDPAVAEITATHQLTHAAFPSPREWIYEGLAHFAQAAYREKLSNRESAVHFMQDYLPAVVDAEKSLAAGSSKDTSASSLTTTTLEELYRSKAMYIWWMLRDMLGESALKDALAAYRGADDTDVLYMQHLIEAKSKRDLSWFFDDWIYHDHGLPDFRIESVYPSQTTPGIYLVTITVENLGNAGAEVPLILQSADHVETRRLEVHAKSKGSIRIVFPGRATQAVVNDGSVPESETSNNTFAIP